MKRALVVLPLLLFPAAAGAQETLAFTGVNVVPMDREVVLRNQTVVVSDGRITTLGSADRVSVPAGATRVAAQGKFLMPGLAEMHGHIPSERSPYAEDVLFLFVANGVTTVRGMQGAPAQPMMRDAIARGELLGPRLYVSSPQMGGRVGTAEDAAALVRQYHAAGYDHIKVQEGLSQDAYDATARTAREVGIPFAGHVTDALSAFHAMEAGQASIDHLDNTYNAVDGHTGRIPELVQAAVRTNTAFVPTEVLWETYILGAAPLDSLIAARPETRYMPRTIVEQWHRNTQRRNAQPDAAARTAFRRQLIEELYDGGALLVFGTDAPQVFSVPGFSIHHEMHVMVEAGLTPYEVLVTGTRNVARYFGTEAETGTVIVGKRADLILLDANPLDDVGNVARRAGVVVNGRWLPATEIDARLEQIAAKHAR